MNIGAYKTKQTSFGSGRWYVDITIDFSHEKNDKVAIFFMGVGGGSSDYDPDRLAKWKKVYLDKGYDVITFNNKNYLKYIKKKMTYWTPKILIKIHLSIINFSIKKLGYSKLILQGWSSGAITLYEARNSKYSDYIFATIFNDPSLKIGAVEQHMKKMHGNNYSIKEAEKISKKFDNYYLTTQNNKRKSDDYSFIIYAEYNYDFITKNSQYLKQSSNKVFYLKNANHSFRLWKANNKTDLDKEDNLIWKDYIKILKEILDTIQ